jgi:hypothetical protein
MTGGDSVRMDIEFCAIPWILRNMDGFTEDNYKEQIIAYYNRLCVNRHPIYFYPFLYNGMEDIEGFLRRRCLESNNKSLFFE